MPGAAIPLTGAGSFGNRRTRRHTHQGVDIAAARNEPAIASAAGIVTHASAELAPGFSGYGRHVVIRHGAGGPWLLYGHLERVDVEPGQRVRASQRVGTVGDTCFSRAAPSKRCSAPHLHFEVSPRKYPQDSEAPRLDPVQWLTGGESSTLPEEPDPLPSFDLFRRRRLPSSGLAGAGGAVFTAAMFGFVALVITNRRGQA